MHGWCGRSPRSVAQALQFEQMAQPYKDFFGGMLMRKNLTRITRLALELTRRCARQRGMSGVPLPVFALSNQNIRCERKFYLADLI